MSVFVLPADDHFVKAGVRIWVVQSLDNPRRYFVLDGVSEREFVVHDSGNVIFKSPFLATEKRQIKKMGFNINEYIC